MWKNTVFSLRIIILNITNHDPKLRPNQWMNTDWCDVWESFVIEFDEKDSDLFFIAKRICIDIGKFPLWQTCRHHSRLRFFSCGIHLLNDIFWVFLFAQYKRWNEIMSANKIYIFGLSLNTFIDTDKYIDHICKHLLPNICCSIRILAVFDWILFVQLLFCFVKGSRIIFWVIIIHFILLFRGMLHCLSNLYKIIFESLAPFFNWIR